VTNENDEERSHMLMATAADCFFEKLGRMGGTTGGQSGKVCPPPPVGEFRNFCRGLPRILFKTLQLMLMNLAPSVGGPLTPRRAISGSSAATAELRLCVSLRYTQR
jgi:hypothetical protein